MVSGYKACAPGHERTRRFAELCTELVTERSQAAILRGELAPTTAIVESSNYPIGLADDVARREGYRSFNLKGMIRATYLLQHEDGITYTRVIEQLSRSNSTPEGTFALFAESGITPVGAGSPDVIALNTPMLYSGNDYTEAVLNVQRWLDAYSGPDVLYGEQRGTQPMHVSYEEVRAESHRREQQLEVYVDKLEAFDIRLERAWQQGLISSEQRSNQHKTQLLNMLRSICLVCPEYADDCFGQEAAMLYREASDYAAMGDYERVDMIMGIAQQYEQPVAVCGEELTAEEAALLGLTPDSTQALTEAAKESMPITKGVCRINNCPSPKPTDIGPCHVCVGSHSCQALFDKGVKDPSKYYANTEGSKGESHETAQESEVPHIVGKFVLAGV
jgi:hypothetical protein